MIEINNEVKEYGQFYNDIVMAGSFISSHTNQRDIIAISKSTSFQQIESFLGSILFNRVPVIIPSQSKKVHREDFFEKIQKIEQAISPKFCISDENDENIFTEFWPTVSKINYSEKKEVPDTDIKETAFVQLSSGTTGIPKIVKVSQKALISHCDEYYNFIGLSNKSVIISWLPLYHDMGLISCFLLPVLKRISFVHINPFTWLLNPGLLFDKIEKYKGTHVWLPNFSFSLLSNIKTKSDLSSIKQIINCSEICNLEDMKNFVQKFSPNGISETMIKTCYALAENVFAVSQSNSLSQFSGVMNCGKIIPGTSVIIVKGGKDVTEQCPGDIYIKSSYEPLSNEHTFYGYYKTGDIGFIKNGELHVMGRSDDMIIIRGRNFYPYTIERDISMIDGVKAGRVACFGVYCKETGTQEIVACFEDDGTRKENDIMVDILTMVSRKHDISICSKHVPAGWITKTSSGKINRKKCKERLNIK
ncbi:MAG: AMP-binding protein [Candidatus Woesearchaeota archaeon]|jgi:acyl-CoA synthetase (AMP-forming)/AMP-acid ligase II